MTRRSILTFAAQIYTDEASRNHQRYVVREFANRYNDLAQCMIRFADKFNAGQGHVWPRREAAALLKAMRRLESAEAFLKEN